ncbi:MAG: hypothetical protein RL283_118, partial [Actinomycetota bacterium]
MSAGGTPSVCPPAASGGLRSGERAAAQPVQTRHQVVGCAASDELHREVRGLWDDLRRAIRGLRSEGKPRACGRVRLSS